MVLRISGKALNKGGNIPNDYDIWSLNLYLYVRVTPSSAISIEKKSSLSFISHPALQIPNHLTNPIPITQSDPAGRCNAPSR